MTTAYLIEHGQLQPIRSGTGWYPLVIDEVATAMDEWCLHPWDEPDDPWVGWQAGLMCRAVL